MTDDPLLLSALFATGVSAALSLVSWFLRNREAEAEAEAVRRHHGPIDQLRRRDVGPTSRIGDDDLPWAEEIREDG